MRDKTHLVTDERELPKLLPLWNHPGTRQPERIATLKVRRTQVVVRELRVQSVRLQHPNVVQSRRSLIATGVLRQEENLNKIPLDAFCRIYSFVRQSVSLSVCLYFLLNKCTFLVPPGTRTLVSFQLLSASVTSLFDSQKQLPGESPQSLRMMSKVAS